MDTAELLTKCAGRDAEAWDRFISLYMPLVRKSVHYKLKKTGLREPAGVIDDISQDIFLKLWENGGVSKVKEPSSLEAWLAILSINETHNYCVKNVFRKNSREFSLDTIGDTNPRGMHELLPSEAKDPHSSLEEKDIRGIMEKAMSSLGPKKRLALRFFFYDGRKQKDIARIMNLPLGSVGILIKRAKEELAGNIKKIMKENPGGYCL